MAACSLPASSNTGRLIRSRAGCACGCAAPRALLPPAAQAPGRRTRNCRASGYGLRYQTFLLARCPAGTDTSKLLLTAVLVDTAVSRSSSIWRRGACWPRACGAQHTDRSSSWLSMAVGSKLSASLPLLPLLLLLLPPCPAAATAVPTLACSLPLPQLRQWQLSSLPAAPASGSARDAEATLPTPAARRTAGSQATNTSQSSRGLPQVPASCPVLVLLPAECNTSWKRVLAPAGGAGLPSITQPCRSTAVTSGLLHAKASCGAAAAGSWPPPGRPSSCTACRTAAVALPAPAGQ